MANTLTISSLAENIFRARDQVARERIGFLSSVIINSDRQGVSINGTVTSFRTAQPTLNTSYTPSMTLPDGDDQTVTVDTMQISQVANVKIPLKGETLRQLDNTVGGQRVLDDMFAQAIRKMVNAIEAGTGTVLKNGASRAVGTAGTNPFASTHNILADARKVLVDNGAPFDGDVSAVFNTTATTALRKLSNLYKVNEAGTGDMLRDSEIMDLGGFKIKESAGVASHTKGTGASYLANGAVAVNGTAVTVDTGTGTIVAGDVITYAADSTNKYVVGSALASNVFSVNQPGVLVAVPDNNAITVGDSYSANVAFHRSAAELAMRPPAQPYGGDAAVDRMTIADDKSPLVFEVAIYKGYGMAVIDITCFYQAKVWKPEFVVSILG